MSEYTPDRWVVLKIKEGKGTFPFYKVLGGWSGSYIYGDSWRMNSGITLVFERENTVDFYGESVGIYNQLKENEKFKGQIQLMPEDTDWSELLSDKL